MKILRHKWFLLTAIVVLFLTYRLLTGRLISETTIMGIIIFAPVLYWCVVPYLVGEDMNIPITAGSLKAGEYPFLRFVFFALGVVLIVLCAAMNPQRGEI